MKISTVVPALLGAVLGSFVLTGCSVEADDDDGTVVTPSPSVNVEDEPDVNVNPAPDVNIKTETTPSSNTTG